MSRLNISSLAILSILLIGSVIATDSAASKFPVYDKENKILMVPRVDTPEQIGAYRGAVFFYNEQTGGWHLSGANVPHEGDLSIDEVTITVTDTFPTQVFLHITGEKFACRELALADQRLKNNLFEVQIHTFINDSAFIGSNCQQDKESFVKVIPLPVYGLKAGTYEYTVNDEYRGTFKLLENNQF